MIPLLIFNVNTYSLEMPDNTSLAIAALKKSSVPDFAQKILEPLLLKFGIDWHSQLSEFEERIGSGSNALSVDIFSGLDPEKGAEFQKTIDEFLQNVANYEKIHGKPEVSPIEGYEEFLENLEYIDWEDDFGDEKSFTIDLIDAWNNERVDFYRTVKKFKLAQARENSYKDLESLNLGGLEEACRTCGVYFFDNLERHRGVESLYCCVTCETNAQLVCIQCQTEFIVGKATKKLRHLMLSGICSDQCNVDFRDSRDADTAYRSSMRIRAQKFGVEYDETITRRLVFQNAKGLCYLCNSKTHFENTDEYSPLLATVDHIIPWSKGGSHIWTNVKLCCLRCNIKKKDRLPGV
jgi:hypothetical protein